MALHLLQYSDVENAFDEPDRVGRLAGGLVSRREALSERGESALVVGTGDSFGPGLLALSTAGEHALSFFEAVEPVAETLGNHDFDHGPARARELVGAAPQEYVVANAFEGEGADARRFAAGETVPWTTVEAGEYAVGVVGVASPMTGTMAPTASELDFREPLAAAREAVAAVRERGLDATVVLAHVGEPLGAKLAAELDVDAVLDGHTHEPCVDVVDGTAYARPGNAAGHFVHATVLAVDGDEAGGSSVPEPELVATSDQPMHESLRETVADAHTDAGLEEVVATVDDPIDCSKAATDRAESRVGNLVTDAYRWAADADVAVMTPGGIRTRDALAGDVTVGDLVGLVPFEGDLVTCEVDGETLRAVLERTTLHDAFETHRKFGHVSGAQVVWDDVEREFRAIRVGGEPLEDAASYRVAATEYFVVTDHLYPELAREHVVDEHGVQYDAIVAYAREVGVDPTLDGRVERPRIGDAAQVPVE